MSSSALRGIRCRIEPYWIKAAPRRAAAARRQRRLCLGRPAGARRTSTRTRSPRPVDSRRRRIRHYRLTAPVLLAANGAVRDKGASSASDCVTLQDRPAKGAPSGRAAKTLSLSMNEHQHLGEKDGMTSP